MPSRLDFECKLCGRQQLDKFEHPRTCSECGGEMEILWQNSPREYIGVHPTERACVWFDPATGKHATPGRNDVPMPETYRKAGYQRLEFTTLRELDSFCKQNNLVNEKAHFNRHGRGYEDSCEQNSF